MAFALVPGSGMAAAPSIGMFGSFFPAWLLCLFGGVIASAVLRVVFVATGLDDILRWRGLVYMAMAIGLTSLLLLLFFGR